jgi:hypothetical protein
MSGPIGPNQKSRFEHSPGFDIHADPISTGHVTTSVDPGDIAGRLTPPGVRPRIIDGRRFAHINASIINHQTRLVGQP